MSFHPSVVAIFSGILYIGAFMAVAVLARICRNVVRSGRTKAVLYPSLYLILAVLLLLFAIERPTAAVIEPLTQVVRSDAVQEGWYATRRDYQSSVLQMVALTAVPALGWILYFIRRSIVRHLLLAVAIVYYICLLSVQLISYHNTDAILMHHFGPVRGLQIVDGFGLCLALGGAAFPLRRLLLNGKGKEFFYLSPPPPNKPSLPRRNAD